MRALRAGRLNSSNLPYIPRLARTDQRHAL
jgi:hypothetical protein